MDIYLVEVITSDGRFFTAFKHLDAARNYQNKMKRATNTVQVHIVPIIYSLH